MRVVKDRRSSLRVVIEGKAVVHTDRDQFAGRCLDLGLEGLAIQSTRAPRSRNLVTIEAIVDGQRLRFDAMPARRQRQGGDYVLGFRFVELDLDTRRRIEHLVFEHLNRSPQAGFMRAFVAHAERVPPPPTAREDAADRTVVAQVQPVPVISGHTQIVAVGELPVADRTVIAPPPARGDTVLASPALHSPAVVMSRVTFDDSWFDDEMDTAEFRLLEAAQRQAMGSDAIDDEPVLAPAPELDRAAALDREPEPTVVTPEPEPTVVVRDAEPTVITRDAEDRPRAEQTAVLFPTQRALGVPEPVALVHTPTMALVLELGALPSGHPWSTEAERTLPLLPPGATPSPSPPPLLRGERVAAPEPTAITPAVLVLRPTLRALLDAAALLRRPDPAPRRGPRVIVAIPHRTYQGKGRGKARGQSRPTVASPWNG